jgi:NADH:ubiquinone oxidoreductase subunit 6 (subunit J)
MIILFVLTAPSFVFADIGTVNLNSFNPIKQTSIYGLIGAVLQFVVKIGAVVVVFFIIYAGFQFVTAQGNEEKISSARKSFMWTIIGGLILLGAMTLSGVVCNTANQLGANVSCG